MPDDPQPPRTLPANPPRATADRVVVDPGCGDGDDAMTVVPIVADDRVAGFEVRCRCGSRIFVECVEGDPCEPSSPSRP